METCYAHGAGNPPSFITHEDAAEDWNDRRAPADAPTNEKLAFERLSMALTGGNAGTWDELFHAAENKADAREHVLYTRADADAPTAIKDRNGDIVLGLCKVCGRGESSLEGPCEPQPAAVCETCGLSLARHLAGQGNPCEAYVQPASADERLAFENYHRSLGYSTSGLAQNVRGYVNSETRSLWLGFQAGAAWQAAAQTRAGGV